jgi:hypothetical protein
VAGRAAYVEFTKDLYDALLAAPLTLAQLKVAMVVVRYTLGHKAHHDGAGISIRWIARRASLNQLTVRRALEVLMTAGVVRCVKPSTGRSPAVLVMEYDSRRWSWLAPGCPKTTPKRKAGGFVVRAAEHTQTDSEDSVVRAAEHTQTDSEDSVVRAAEHTVCVLPSTHNGDLCVSLSTHSEARSAEARTLKDGSSSADAPPPSSELEQLPRSFHLPGYGEVYEYDTWAMDQPDARPLYVKTFGIPSRKRSSK